jgi:hypothetical protein
MWGEVSLELSQHLEYKMKIATSVYVLMPTLLSTDMYFDMRSKALPIECAQDPTSLDCTNPEVTANDLVITKLILEVDTDSYSTNYGRCNVCVNHTDHHGTAPLMMQHFCLLIH